MPSLRAKPKLGKQSKWEMRAIARKAQIGLLQQSSTTLKVLLKTTHCMYHPPWLLVATVAMRLSSRRVLIQRVKNHPLMSVRGEQWSQRASILSSKLRASFRMIGIGWYAVFYSEKGCDRIGVTVPWPPSWLSGVKDRLIA